MTEDIIRVVLADDHAVVRAGLRAVLGAAKNIEVVGEAKNGREAVDLAERLKPDVVVMDLSMPELDGREATREIVEKKLSAHVLMLTMHAEEEFVIPALEAGVSGYLVKDAADRELVAAVRAIAQGQVYLGPSVGRVMARFITTKQPVKAESDQYDRLTERERDVVKLVAQGLSAPEIAEALLTSVESVRTHKERIHEKMGFSHRADYLNFALKLKLIAS